MKLSSFSLLAILHVLPLISASPTPKNELLERSSFPPCMGTGIGVCNLWIVTPRPLGVPGINPFKSRFYQLYSNNCTVIQTEDVDWPNTTGNSDPVTTLKDHLPYPVHVHADDGVFPGGYI